MHCSGISVRNPRPAGFWVRSVVLDSYTRLFDYTYKAMNIGGDNNFIAYVTIGMQISQIVLVAVNNYGSFTSEL